MVKTLLLDASSVVVGILGVVKDSLLVATPVVAGTSRVVASLLDAPLKDVRRSGVVNVSPFNATSVVVAAIVEVVKDSLFVTTSVVVDVSGVVKASLLDSLPVVSPALTENEVINQKNQQRLFCSITKIKQFDY